MHRTSRAVPYLTCVRHAVWLCAFTSSALAAQDAPTQPPAAAAAASQQDTARAAYARGVDAYTSENYALAREQFTLAERAFPSPNIELMLGRSLMKRPYRGAGEPGACDRAKADRADRAGDRQRSRR